jgi:phage tail tape-measure protein
MTGQDDTQGTAQSGSAALSVVGGFVGTVLGSRQGKAGAVVGGLVGGTLGYLAGASDSNDIESADEPVVVTVDGTDDGETAE